METERILQQVILQYQFEKTMSSTQLRHTEIT